MECPRCGDPTNHEPTGFCPKVREEKRYIQIEVMLPCDGEGMTSEAWDLYEKMRKDWSDYFFNQHLRISNPFNTSRPELKHWEGYGNGY